MDRPTAEDFAQAPLFRLLPEPDALDWLDHSAEGIEIGAHKLTREVTEGGMRFLLDGVPVLDALSKTIDDEQHWEGKLFDGTEFNIPDANETEATAEFVGIVLNYIENSDDDDLAFFMEENGVEFGRDWADVRRGYNYEGNDAEDCQSVTVRVVREGLSAWVEGEDTPRSWEEISGLLVRLSEDGTPLTSAGLPLMAQLRVIAEAVEGAERHHADLRGLRTLLGTGTEIAHAMTRADAYTFDMIDSGAKDQVVPQEAIRDFAERASRAPLQLTNVNPVLREAFAEILGPEDLIDPTNPPVTVVATMPLDVVYHEKGGAPLMHCQEVRTYPAYFQEQLRMVARHFLAPHIGDFPMEKLVRAQAQMGDEKAEKDFMDFWEAGELVKEIGTFRFDSIPELRDTMMGKSDYETSVARVWRRDGWDAVVFSDFMGIYAYARPTPKLDHELDSDGPDDGGRFTM